MSNAMLRTSDQISLEALAHLAKTTDITHISDGTIAKAIVQAASILLAEHYDTLNEKILQSVIRTATGTNLDTIGEMLNTPRGGLALAHGSSIQQFYSLDGVTPILDLVGAASLGGVIQAGTAVYTTDGSIRYLTTDTVAIGATDTQVTVSVTAENEGSDYNVGKNTLIAHGLNVVGLSTTNLEAIDNGSSEQSDDEYRVVLSKAVTIAEAANETAVRYAALSTPGVSTVLVNRYFYGAGTYSVLVVGTAPITPSSVLRDVEARVRRVSAVGEYFTIRSPRYVGIEVAAKLIFRDDTLAEDKVTIALQAEDAIYDYLNNILLGKPFVRNELIQRIMDVSEQILDVDDNDDSDTKLAVWYWLPDVVDIVNGETITNRIRAELDRNYDGFFDDKIVAEVNMQGYEHESDFSPVRITY